MPLTKNASAVRNTLPTLCMLRILSNTTIMGVLSDCLNSFTDFRFNSSIPSLRMCKDRTVRIFIPGFSDFICLSRLFPLTLNKKLLMRKHFLFTGLLVLSIRLFAQNEKVDLTIVDKIRQEGLQHSQVMDIAFHLTDASGNRLTSSPGFFRAANYAKQQLTQWGLTDAALDPWGDFGKGWDLQKSYVAMTAPYYKPLIAYPKAWCGGTDGLKSGSVLLISAKDSADLDKYKGQLAGKILIPEVNE